MSFAEFQDLVSDTRAFEALGASTNAVMNVSGETQAPERFRGAFISAGTLALLRSAPILGRAFLAADDTTGAANRSS